MGVPTLLATDTVQGSPVAIDVETVIATVTGVSTSMGDTVILLKAYAAFTTGAGATSRRLRIRRDSLTGAIVKDSGVITAGVAASAVTADGIEGNDSIPASGSRTYVLTGLFSGGAATTAINAVSLTAEYTAS